MNKRLGQGCAHALVGESAAMVSVRRLIEKAARNRLPVLLLGESGTGKEVVARAIHDANPQGRFVPIDCGSLVGTLMESELFGHIKGAFSGAVENKKGLMEVANGGTAFLDEIGDLPLEMQVKLLRLVQEKELRPVGALDWRKVDLRIIAATHRNLKAEVAAGRFRLDLFYRLNVFIIHLPALRDRREDIPLLVEYFLRGVESAGLERFQPGSRILRTLVSYDWPGNVRELKHCVERMAALNSDGVVHPGDMPSGLREYVAGSDLQRLSHAVVNDPDLPDARLAPPSPVISLRESEIRTITAALEATRGERGRAAELLKMSRTTLYRRMKEYGIE